MLSRITTLALSLTVVVPAMATAGSANQLPYRSARVLGMGGAATATPGGADVLWQNPAALAFRESGIAIEVLNPIVGISEGARIATNNGRAINDAEQLFRSAPNAAQQPISGSAALFPNLLTKHFGVGILVGGRPEAVTSDREASQIDVAGRADAGMVASGAYGIGSNLAVGMSAKALKRIRYSEQFDTTSDESIDPVQGAEEGFVGGLDAGLMLRFPGAVASRLGVEVTDALVTALPDPYSAVDGARAYDTSTIRPALNVGVGATPEIGDLKVETTLNFRDVAGTESIGDRISAGVEAKAFDIFAIRGGVAYGRPTAGFGVDLRLLRLDAATYAEPSMTGAKVFDRHFVLQVVAGF